MILGIGVGIVIGLVLGLTGAGGSIFALPLLILLLGLAPANAAVIALCAVAASAIFGTLTRMLTGQISWLPALVFASVGSVFTPLGAWLNSQTPDTYILVGFSLIVVYVAVRMWRQASSQPQETRVSRAQVPHTLEDPSSPYCVMNDKEAFKIGPRCIMGMFAGACISGILAGLFGVGGGFIIVPSLVFLTGISIHQAVATSLLVISAVSSSAILSHFVQGNLVMTPLLLQVGFGGILGMILGTLIGTKVSGPQLQKVFAGSIVVLSILVTARHFGIF